MFPLGYALALALSWPATGEADSAAGQVYADLTDIGRGARNLANVVVSAELPEGHRRGEPRAFQPIEDPTGHALDHFYGALAKTDAGHPGAITRVLHMGDSSIGLDGLPHAIRTRMQDRFGDGGAGFVLLGQYSKNYGTKVMSLRASQGWDVCYIAYLCRKDGRYGLGGHVFRGTSRASAQLSTLSKGEYGRSASHFELWYAATPRGGSITMRVDGAALHQEIDAHADVHEDRWARLDVPPGEHTLTIEGHGAPYVWAYGVVAETEGPGVVWDSVSMIGAYTKRLLGYDDAHIAAHVEHRDANLLVLNYGGNDLRRLVSGAADPDTYATELAAVIDKLRRGKPEMSCLVVSVIDHGKSGPRTVEHRHVDAMVATQRRVAFERGCAFFDSVAAMGGAGSIHGWKKHVPPLASPDLKHLSRQGRLVMGSRIFAALLAGYEARHAPLP